MYRVLYSGTMKVICHVLISQVQDHLQRRKLQENNQKQKSRDLSSSRVHSEFCESDSSQFDLFSVLFSSVICYSV